MPTKEALSEVIIPVRKIRVLPVTIEGKMLVSNPVLPLHTNSPPDERYRHCLTFHRLSKGIGYGVHSATVKKALRRAWKAVTGKSTPMMCVVTTYIPPHDEKKELLRVTAKHGPYMRKDAVHFKERKGRKGYVHIVTRVAWEDWKISFKLHFFPDTISAEQLHDLLALAGYGGIMSQRVDYGSQWGTFTVKTGKDRPLSKKK